MGVNVNDRECPMQWGGYPLIVRHKEYPNLTLELNRVLPQLDAMGRELIKREKGHSRIATEALALLEQFSANYEYLRDLAERAREQDWQAAIPVDEPLRQTAPAPPHPDRVSLIATDGSQVEPDSHGVAQYYLINIGSMVFRYGSGNRPEVSSEPTLYYTTEDLYENDRQIQGDLLAAKRDVAELRKLADLAEQEDAELKVAFSDGPLLHWLSAATFAGSRDYRLQLHFDQLDRLRASGAALAGYVSRPRYTAVTVLLYLAQVGEDFAKHTPTENPFRGITDRQLFRFLKPGERSALFVSPRPTNVEYQAAGHEICFFYLNTGTEICRVEVPRWSLAETAAHGQSFLDLVHATIYEQCRILGTPYTLTRAHELAVITGADREILDKEVTTALVRYGMRPRISEKARAKKLVGGLKYKKRR